MEETQSESIIQTISAIFVTLVGTNPECADAAAYAIMRTLHHDYSDAFDNFLTGIKDALISIKEEG